LRPDNALIETIPVGTAEHRSLALKKGVLCPEADVWNPDNAPVDAGPGQAQLNAAAGDSNDWLLPSRGYDGQRFSPLDQITPDNVGGLANTCTFDTGDDASFQTSPLVHDGVMYFTTSTSTIAIDAADCSRKWRYDRPLRCTELWGRSRGLALKDGYVVRGTTDGYLLALNAATGKPVWERRVNDTEVMGMAVPMPPLVFEDRVIVGAATSEAGIKGWIQGFDLQTGKRIWNFNVVPDAGEEAASTWGDEEILEHGGGGVWTAFTLDSNKGIAYAATGNPGPALMPDKRPGSNLYTNSIVALDARSGKLLWHEQMVPEDFHDWDLTQSSPLLRLGGRELVMVGGKDGYLRALDRNSRETLYSVEISKQKNADVMTRTDRDIHFCPGSYGGMQWNGPAFSPATGYLYVPSVEWCTSMRQAEEVRYVRGSFYMGGYFSMDPVEKAWGKITALDAASGKEAWRYDSTRPVLAAVTPTASGLLFAGEMTGDFIVLDAKTGKKLYSFDTGAPLNAGVITYAVDGRQYVAVAAGAASSIWLDRPAQAKIRVFALPE
ncbi:MAG: PQQ-binding-like beta-propeller repeat protein, partial [Gammaproteobacteria bacterium]